MVDQGFPADDPLMEKVTIAESGAKGLVEMLHRRAYHRIWMQETAGGQSGK